MLRSVLLLALAFVGCHRERPTRHRFAAPVVRTWAQSDGELPLDRVIEITVDGPGSESAFLVVVDAHGARLADPLPFERTWPSRELRAVASARTFTPAEGIPRGLVLRGRRDAVERALRGAPGAGVHADALELPVPAAAAIDESSLSEAESALLEDPRRALARIDAVRGTATGDTRARADAIAADGAFAYGRTHLAASLARRGIASAPPPSIERRLLRTLILALAEAQEPHAAERARLAEVAVPDEAALDDGIDLALAELHDRIAAGTRHSSEAAKKLLARAREADDVRLAAMFCRAGAHVPSTDGARALQRGLRLAARSGNVAHRAMCLIRAGDAAVDAGKLDEGERSYAAARAALGERDLPREQREAAISAAYAAAARGDEGLAFERALASFRWIDVLLHGEHDLRAREALFTNVLGYFAIAERFGIRAGEPTRAIAAGERGKGSAFGLLSAGGAAVDVSALGAWFAPNESSTASEDPRERLRDNEAVITHTLLGRNDEGKPELAIGVVTKTDVHAMITVVPADLQQLIEAHGRAVEANDEPTAKALGARLHEIIIAPIAPLLGGVTRLLVSPHLRLHALSFAALHDGRGWLAERFAIARIPPLPFFRGRAGLDSTPRRWVTAIAPPHPPLAALPGFETIADDLVRPLSPVADLRSAAVTPARTMRALAAADALLYAGHARYEPTAPLTSALLLASGELRAVDVLRMHHPIDTVVLVGCETARSVKGRASFGDDAIGLQRAFLAAGARQVVGALWPVLDRDAEDFARALFSGASNDMATAAATAQRCMIAARCPSRGIAAWASYAVDLR